MEKLLVNENATKLTVSDVEVIDLKMDIAKTPVVHIILEDSRLFHSEEDDEITQYLVNRIESDKDIPNFVKVFFSEAHEDAPVFYVSIPLQYAQISQLVGMLLPSPNFVVSSEDEMVVPSDAGDYELEDFSVIIDFDLSSSPAFAQVTSILTKLTTGRTSVNVNLEVFNGVRAEIIDLVTALVNGDETALVKAYSLINPITELNKAQLAEDFQATPEQERLVVFVDLVANLLNETNPVVLSTKINPPEDSQNFISDVESFEGIMRASGLTDAAFSDLTPEVTQTADSKVAFVSQPITPDSFPQKMAKLASKIAIPELYSTNWGITEDESDDDEEKPASENTLSGEMFVAGLIVVAIRLGRVEEVASDNNELEPIILLIKALSVPGEENTWAASETIKLLAQDKKRPFNEVFVLTVPNREEPRSALNAPLGLVLHEFGHMVSQEGWRRDIMAIALKDLPIMLSFIDEILEQGEHESSDDEHDSEQMCGPAKAAVNLLGLGFTIQDIVDQLGQFMLVMAELNAHKHTDYKKNSTDWNSYMKNYLASILEHHEMNDDDDDEEDVD